MKILMIGVGGVGEAIAVMSSERDWVEKLVLADFNISRAAEIQQKLGDPTRFPIEFVDASQQDMVEDLARKYQIDLIMNAVDPIYNEKIFDAAFQVGATYLDMAMTLSTPNENDPFNLCGVKLGDYQFAKSKEWEQKSLLLFV